MLQSPVSESNAPVPAIFPSVLDRVLRLHRGDRRQWLSSVRDALERYPDVARFDRARLLRGVAIDDAFNRIVMRLELRFPAAATALTHLVPIVGPRAIFGDVAPDRPIILALMHFGPIYFFINTSRRLFPTRRVYVLHAGGDNGNAVGKYFTDIGCIPVVIDRGALESLKHKVLEDGRCAVIFCFDHLSGRRRRTVPFLGGRLSVPTGLAYLADAVDGVVVPAWYERRSGLRIGEPLAFDRTADIEHRRNDFTDRIFALLEARVRAWPRAWTEWSRCTE